MKFLQRLWWGMLQLASRPQGRPCLLAGHVSIRSPLPGDRGIRRAVVEIREQWTRLFKDVELQ